MKKILLSFFAFLLTGFVYSQSFEGVIEFTMEISDNNDITKSSNVIESKYFVKGDKIRSEYKPENSQLITQIIDNEKNVSTKLLTIGDRKFAIVDSINKAPADDDSTIITKVEHYETSKKIAGYNCNKVEIVKGNITIYIWVTDEIEYDSYFKSYSDSVNGFVLSYEKIVDDETTKLTVKEIEIKRINDSKFTIPSSYEETTMHEIENLYLRR